MTSLGLTSAEQWDFTLFLAAHARGNPDTERLGQLLSKTFADETVKRIKDFLQDLENEWNYPSILGKVWPLYKNRLLPAFHGAEAFEFAQVGQGLHSGFWKQCLCFLALWKFPVPDGDHRPALGRGPVRKLSVEEMSGLEDFDKLRPKMREIWCQGRDWLDNEVRVHDWGPPDPFNSSPGRASVEELAMYLFVRSHLAWQNGKLDSPVPVEAVRSLRKRQNDQHLWPSIFDPKGPNDASVSLRASALAVAALGDWCFSSRDDQETKDLRQDVQTACREAIQELLRRQGPDGSWSDDSDHNTGYLWTTSQVFYACGRFVGDLDPEPGVEPARNRIDRAENWLLNALAVRTSQKESRTGEALLQSIQEVSVALTALARRTGPGGTIWLRQAIRWLFYACEQATQSAGQSGVSLADVWLLYSVIEIIRREQCAALLEPDRVI